jgi:ribosome-binding factor A
VQAAIGRQVRMKRTPALEFVADPAVAAGERIETVLRHHRDDPRPGLEGQ